ncbi:UNVERIFIED_CONTAM: Methyl-CpG-binding domain-containing protein 9 [Sesamum radiatum]|uniref:Methyl-CpG-binding domain-containing protein 9 n=1 Tax=Sesamum radiatum TaxID=300843 RepID=A0AAW2MY31_SESRA
MEDVARHLGLQSRYHYLETENGSNEFAVSRTGLKIDPVKKVSSAFLAAQNCRQRQRGSNSQGFLSSSGTIAGIVDPRPSYHNTDQIWPVGYRASWHDRITGSLFVCDVADGGDSGPIFKIQRYPCTMQSTPVGSTILSKKKQIPCKGDDQRSGNLIGDAVGLNDVIGDFQVEGRSTSSVWEMVSQAFLFGLDADFVQEIIEQLPGVTACSEYKNLNDRKHNSGLQTVWELAWRFLEVLGLEQPFSFHELESELVSPWLDSYPLDSRYETVDIRDAAPSGSEKASQAGAACHGRCTGLLLAKILGSLLKLLSVSCCQKAAVYVCPNFDAGESKSRRGRKKDLDCLAALKKTKIDMLPVNELTWQEIARRYILAVLSMEGNLDSTEIASRESGKVFHCLRGDGGILCGSLMGVAALERDAVVLADAMKEIFGSLKSKNEVVSLCERESDINGAQTIEVSDSVIPEWAQVLEPVRKLPQMLEPGSEGVSMKHWRETLLIGLKRY